MAIPLQPWAQPSSLPTMHLRRRTGTRKPLWQPEPRHGTRTPLRHTRASQNVRIALLQSFRKLCRVSGLPAVHHTSSCVEVCAASRLEDRRGPCDKQRHWRGLECQLRSLKQLQHAGHWRSMGEGAANPEAFLIARSVPKRMRTYDVVEFSAVNSRHIFSLGLCI